KCRSVCMLPSSGAWQLSTNGPSDVRALSAESAAIAVGPSPMPPNSAGMCGSQRPHSLAFPRSSRMVLMSRPRPSGSCRSMVRSPSAGFTTVVMNSRTRWRMSSTSGGKVKSIMGAPSLPAQGPGAAPLAAKRAVLAVTRTRRRANGRRGTMNGIHDLGGMDGLGPVEVEANEPVFHAQWERVVFRSVLGSRVGGNLHAFRHAIERMDPAHYLTSSYYEHWLTGLATLMIERGVITPDQLEARAGGRVPPSRPIPPPPPAGPPASAAPRGASRPA